MSTKKKVAIINAVPYGSTGKITKSISALAEQSGYDTFSYYSWTKNYQKSDKENIMVGSFLGKSLHIFRAKLNGKHGCYSRRDTKRLIKRLKEFSPDIINLHILHSWSVNLPLLFDYIKENNIKVVWTFHDCWAFTGQCPHFVMAKCDRWKTGCYECSQYRNYPSAYVDKTRQMYALKKEWFTGVPDMTIVTPSEWLGNLVKESFFKEYPVRVINNGIDLEIFKPTESDFREKYSLEDKKIVLGVAFDWGKRKGLDVFVELSRRLPDNYRIVLVGTSSEIDAQLPKNIITINRTANQAELAEIYSVADVFVNPTREDTYSTVNMEAIACGAPIVSFRTGGSPEMLDDTCSVIVDVDDTDAMEREILRVCEEKPYSAEACLERAKSFNKDDKFEKYIELFDEIIKKA